MVGTDKEVGETADRIEAARLAQQQLTQEDLLAQPIQPPQKQITNDPVAGHQVTFKYDADGNITEKNADGVITQYLVESHIRPYAVILAEYDGAGNQIASYTYGLDHRPISQKRNGHRYRYTYANGNVVAITNENGQITDQYTYDAFGKVIDHIKTENSVINRFLAKGEYLDEDAGFYNLRARYYDPGTGRFISKDSWEGRGADPITLNKYLYANGNPVMGSDPSGHMMIMEMLALIGANETFSQTSIPDYIARTGWFLFLVKEYGSFDSHTPYLAIGELITKKGTILVSANSWADFSSYVLQNPREPNQYVRQYPSIQEGEYFSRYHHLGHKGKTNGIRLRDGLVVPTMEPNPQQNYLSYADGVNVHCGKAAERGSTNCITVKPTDCSRMWTKLEDDWKGWVILRRYAPIYENEANINGGL